MVPPPSAAEVDTLLAQLEEISRPSRVLAVFDASASMRGVSPSGPTRAQIAQDAAKSSLALFPDTADIGTLTLSYTFFRSVTEPRTDTTG